MLGATSMRINQKLTAICCTTGIITLAKNTPTRAIVTVVVLPGDNKAAVGESRYVGVALLTCRQTVDLPFRTDRHAVGVKALGISTPAAAILPIGLPHCYVATTRECGHFG